MRKSLFALENDDSMNNAAEMEVSGEEGEAAAALTETGDDASEIAELAEAASEGTEAADQMGEVEALVEDAVENGEGLDPVAAEAVRISVEAICGRIGANPRSVYSLYATENFQSASSRKANSRIALEGIGEFLKNLYARIKAALTKMWEKIKAFWAKHISTLGRVKKALEAMKTKVGSSSGKIEGRSVIEEAPSSMVDAFAGKGTINTAVVEKFIKSHEAASKEVNYTSDGIKGVNDAVAATKTTFDIGVIFSKFKTHTLGTEAEPLVGGVWIEYEIEKESDSDKATVNVTRNNIDDKETKRQLTLTDKAEVKSLLDKTLVIINATIKSKELSDKADAAAQKFLQSMEKTVNEIEKDASNKQGGANTSDEETIKKLRNMMGQMYLLNSKLGTQPVEMLNQNIRLAKAVMGYSALCLKSYK